MSAPGPADHDRRILLVEERAASRDLIQLVLSKLDYRLETVETAAAALRCLNERAFSLVILSSTLPDMPAPELIRRTGALPTAGRPLRALIIHAEAGDDVRRACLAAGALEVLDRPLEIDRLLRLVKRVVQSAPGPKPAVDLDHLAGFTDGDPQLEGELSALFLSSAAVYLERMDEALKSGASWQEAAHALKGASANLGARRVAALALHAEHSAPDDAQLEEIRRAVDEVRQFFTERHP